MCAQASEAALKQELESLKSALAASQSDTQDRDRRIAALQSDIEALKKQAAADMARAEERFRSELDKQDKDWASKAALRVGAWMLLLLLFFFFFFLVVSC